MRLGNSCRMDSQHDPNVGVDVEVLTTEAA